MAYSITASEKRRAFIAFGSNVGDRVAMIEEALRAMERREIRLVRASSLWETEAMYVVDQAPFLNGVCEVGLPKLGLYVMPLVRDHIHTDVNLVGRNSLGPYEFIGRVEMD